MCPGFHAKQRYLPIPYIVQAIKQADSDKRQPVLPDTVIEMGPLMMAISGKAALDDAHQVREEHGVESGSSICPRPLTPGPN